MTLKMLVEKDKQARRLRAGAKAVARDVGAVEQKLAPFLANGETLPDVALLATLAVRRAHWLLGKLADAVEAGAKAGAALALARDHRRDACRGVTAAFSRLRRLFLSLFGDALPVRPCYREPIPESPAGLLRHAEIILAALRRPDPGLPEGPCVTLDPEQLAAGLQPSVAALRDALAEVEAGEAEIRHVQWTLRRIKAVFEAEYAPTRRLLEALSSLTSERGGKG